MTRIVLHVDRLVLNGFERKGACPFADSLGREFGSSLRARDIVAALASGGDIARVHVAPVRVGSSTRPEQMGARVARGIVRVLKS